MEKKIVITLEIIVIFGLFIFYTFSNVIPDVKNKYGSSDKFINADNYKLMYEFNIDNDVNFSIVLDNDNKIYHLFFFDENSLCLYNKKIEGNDLNVGLNSIYTLLSNNNYLNDVSNIRILRYNDNSNNILDKINELNNRYKVKGSVEVLDNTLENKARSFNLNNSDDKKILLRNIDFYSKEFIRRKNDTIKSNKDIDIKGMSDNVYTKISNYVKTNNISDIDINSSELVITLIEGDNNYYPSNNSWYYVKNKNVYAYIEFVIDDFTIKGYCYNGNINEVREGECNEEEIGS